MIASISLSSLDSFFNPLFAADNLFCTSRSFAVIDRIFKFSDLKPFLWTLGVTVIFGFFNGFVLVVLKFCGLKLRRLERPVVLQHVFVKI